MDEDAAAQRHFDHLFPEPPPPSDDPSVRRRRFASPSAIGDLGLRRSASGFLSSVGLGRRDSRSGRASTPRAVTLAQAPKTSPSFYDFVFGATTEDPVLLPTPPRRPLSPDLPLPPLDPSFRQPWDNGGHADAYSPAALGSIPGPSTRPSSRDGTISPRSGASRRLLRPPDVQAMEDRGRDEESRSPPPCPPSLTPEAVLPWAHQLFGFETHTAASAPPVVVGGLHEPREQPREPSSRSLGESSASSSSTPSGPPPRILTESLMAQLAPALPSLARQHNWKLLYSLRNHGASFSTMGRAVRLYSSTLLVLKTAESEVLGGFATRPWDLQGHEEDATYYGTGQSFLFRVAEEAAEVFRWSRRNSYFQLASHHSLAFGAGGESFGLYLGRDGLGYDLATGSSGACDTYANEPLAPISGRDFAIVEIEVWAPSQANTEQEALCEAPPAVQRRRRQRG